MIEIGENLSSALFIIALAAMVVGVFWAIMR